MMKSRRMRDNSRIATATRRNDLRSSRSGRFIIAALLLAIMAAVVFQFRGCSQQGTSITASAGQTLYAPIAEDSEPTRISTVEATVNAADEPERETLCEDVPVLPGIADIEFSSCTGGQLSQALANEPLDTGWASGMEARIRDFIRGQEQLTLFRLEVVCRQASCGILFELDEDEYLTSHTGQLLRILIESLAGSLGFSKSTTMVVSGGATTELRYRAVFLEQAEDREHLLPATPEVNQMEALSGVSGYIVPAENRVPQFNFPTAPELLAVEPIDADWSAAMQGEIYRQLSLMTISVSQLHVECKTTRCGVIVDYGRDPGFNERQAAIAELRDLVTQLGLNDCSLGVNPFSTTSFTAMYFEYRDGSGCALDTGRTRPP